MGRQQRPLRYRLEGWLGWSGSTWSPPKDLPSFSKAPSTCFHIFQSSFGMLQKYTEILFHQLMSLMSRYLFSCSLEYHAIMHPKPWMWVMWVWYVDALMHRAFNWWRSVNSQAAFATWPRLAKETVASHQNDARCRNRSYNMLQLPVAKHAWQISWQPACMTAGPDHREGGCCKVQTMPSGLSRHKLLHHLHLNFLCVFKTGYLRCGPGSETDRNRIKSQSVSKNCDRTNTKCIKMSADLGTLTKFPNQVTIWFQETTPKCYAKWCEMQIWGLRAKANQTWSRLNSWAPKSASLKILIGVLLQILQEGLKFSTGKGPRKPDENSTLVYAPVVFSIAVSFPVGCSSCISYRYFPVPVKMHWCTQEMLLSSLAMSAKLKRASPMSVIRCIARCIRCEDCKVMDKELKLQTSTQTQNRHSVQAEHRQSKAKNLQLTSLNKVPTELTALLRTTEYAKEEVSSAMPKRHKIWRS